MQLRMHVIRIHMRELSRQYVLVSENGEFPPEIKLNPSQSSDPSQPDMKWLTSPTASVAI